MGTRRRLLTPTMCFWLAGVSLLASMAVLASCASTESPRPAGPRHALPPGSLTPDLAEMIAERYPPDRYLLGLGQADSEEAAVEFARADLAKKIRIKVSSLSQDLVRVRNGVTEREVSRLVLTKTEELMDGVEVAAQGRDSDTGRAYAVVVLPKARVNSFDGAATDSAALSGLPDHTPAPADPIWVTAEGTVPFGADTTLQEAASRSRDQARRRAVEQATGAFVRAQTLVYNTDVAEVLVRSTVHGVVIEEEVLEEGIRAVSNEHDGTAFLYATKLRARVKPLPFGQRGDFALDVALNRAVFQEGDEVQVTVVPSRDAYVYILNVRQNDDVTLLFPNRFAEDNFVVAQQELVFPTDHQRDLGLQLRVVLPPGEGKAIEKVKVLATSKRLESRAGEVPERVFPTQQHPDRMTVTDVMKHLALLEDTAWTQKTVPYEVRR